MLTYPPQQIQNNIPQYTHPTSFEMNANTPHTTYHYQTNTHYKPPPQTSSSTVKLSLIPQNNSNYNQRNYESVNQPTLSTYSTISNKYSPIELIGKGTFGDIYKVFDINTKKEYAMKMIKKNTNWSNNKQRQIELVFLREGKKIIELNNIKTAEMGKHFIINCKEILYRKHKNICNNIMNKSADNYISLQPCIIMELFGCSLIQYIKLHETNHIRISLNTIRIITIQILAAMSFIHGIGKSIHCDIKSENILIETCNNYPKIKLIDFGNILSINKQIKTFNIQTIWYRSPEVLFGNHKYISSLMDMWSVGCILYELYTINIGQYHRLFQCNINDNNNDKMQVIYKICNELSLFPICVYNKFNSYHFIEKLQIYHYENNYMKLKANRFYKLMMKLNSNCINYKTYENMHKNEFINFIDLLTCLLDLNPMSRYTSEDAIRHPFIIGDEISKNNNDLRCNNIHPIIKSSNDIERQCRINELINKYKMDLNNENGTNKCNANYNENYNLNSKSFPIIITKQNLY